MARQAPPGDGAAAPGASGTLARDVGVWGAVWLGLGSILGTGVFVSLGIAAGVAGSGLLVAIALAALVATANGLSSAQLAAAHPVSGGTYEYGHRLLHPAAGFAAGWLFLCAKSASAATAALGFAAYLLHLLGADGGRATRTAVALALVVLLTALVAGGVRRSNRVNLVVVSLTLLALAAFVVFGVITLVARAGPGPLTGASLLESFDRPLALLEATALVFVAYTGYGRIATLGEEVHSPKTTIPRAIVATLLITMAVYVAVGFTALAAAGPAGFSGATGATAAPLEVVASGFAHPWVAVVVAIGATTAMSGVLLNLLLGLSRVMLAMARRGELPRGLAHVDAATHSPRRAVVAVGVIIGALTLIGDVKTTWSFSAFTVLVYYGITNLAALRLPAADRLFPRWVAAAGLVACVGLAFFVEPAVWLSGLALLAAGFIARAVITRRDRAAKK